MPSPDATARRVAVLADVHGNATALEAVLEDAASERPDLLVQCGDLTWHGSPRSDEELITRRTPEERLAEALIGVEADVIVTAHTHVRYERVALGRRLLNAGSVGLPYEGRPGAYWALLGPDVEFRRTEYDLDRAADVHRASGDPRAEELIELLGAPPTAEEATARAESLGFSG